MNRYEHIIIKKLNESEIDEELLNSITNMIDFYFVSKVANSSIEKLIFNIIYSIVGGQDNIRAVINTNPFKLDKFIMWANFLITFFNDQDFSQIFYNEVQALKKQNFISEFELSDDFFEKVKENCISTNDENRITIPQKDISLINFGPLLYEGNLNIHNLSLSDSDKKILLYYYYCISDWSNVLYLSLSLKCKLKQKINLKDCNIEQILGVWLLNEQK